MTTESTNEPQPEQGPITPASQSGQSLRDRWGSVVSLVRALIKAINEGDDALVEAAVIDLSSRRRIYAPLGMVVGAFMTLFGGLKLLVFNWRLLLIQLLPAMWIWLAMVDLKAHVFHGKSFHTLHGIALLLGIALIALITVASAFLNAVFAFAVSQPGKPKIRPAFAKAKEHQEIILGHGLVMGILLGVAALYVDRWGPPWFALSMSIMIGIMMLAYVTVPSRLIGVKPTASTTEKLKTTLVGGTIGAVVCFPPYAMGRIGILMLGNRFLFIPGIILLSIGITLEVGATSSIKAIKMSAKLISGTKVAGAAPPATA